MKKYWVAIVALLLAGPAWADLTATFTMKGGQQLVVSYRDLAHIRMTFPDDSYALLTGNKVYIVSQEEGEWVATDMDKFKQMTISMPFGGDVGSADSAEKYTKLVDTGRKERIAGYQGTVYDLVDSRYGKRYEMVMSDHPEITTLYRGLLNITQTAVGKLGATKGLPRFIEGQGGLLRQADSFILVKMDKSKKASDYYKLPAGVKMRDLSAIGGSPMGMPSAQDIQRMDPESRERMMRMLQQQYQGQ